MEQGPQRVLNDNDDDNEVVDNDDYCSACADLAHRDNIKHSILVQKLQSQFETYALRQKALIASLIEWGPISPSYGDPNPRPRLEAAEEDKLLDTLNEKLAELSLENGKLRASLQREVRSRKRLHNIVQDLKGKIRVFVRVRPLSSGEEAAGCQHALRYGGEGSVLAMPEGRLAMKTWDFDGVLGVADGQVDVFREVSGEKERQRAKRVFVELTGQSDDVLSHSDDDVICGDTHLRGLCRTHSRLANDLTFGNCWIEQDASAQLSSLHSTGPRTRSQRGRWAQCLPVRVRADGIREDAHHVWGRRGARGGDFAPGCRRDFQGPGEEHGGGSDG